MSTKHVQICALKRNKFGPEKHVWIIEVRLYRQQFFCRRISPTGYSFSLFLCLQASKETCNKNCQRVRLGFMVVQSLFACPGRAKKESRITCMRRHFYPPKRERLSLVPRDGKNRDPGNEVGETTFGSTFQVRLVARFSE